MYIKSTFSHVPLSPAYPHRMPSRSTWRWCTTPAPYIHTRRERLLNPKS